MARKSGVNVPALLTISRRPASSDQRSDRYFLWAEQLIVGRQAVARAGSRP